jgi:hypothetical protein
MQRISGVVTVVQEGRFRMSTDDGRSILFTLHHGAEWEAQDLPSLQRSARVVVSCADAPGRAAMVAHAIRPAGAR